jgi:transcriptional regulator with XRE-family HTH domain
VSSAILTQTICLAYTANKQTKGFYEMTLSEWIKGKGWSDQQAAKHFGISRSVLNRLRTGVRKPTFDHMSRIWYGTKGKIKLSDWITEEEQARLVEEVRQS